MLNFYNVSFNDTLTMEYVTLVTVFSHFVCMVQLIFICHEPLKLIPVEYISNHVQMYCYLLVSIIDKLL